MQEFIPNPKHVKEAESAGLELIGIGKNCKYSTYRVIECGHVGEFYKCLVRRGAVRCRQCFRERLDQEAHDVGLELLGAGKNVRSRTYKFIECAHVREIETGAVRNGQIRCQQCLDERLIKEAEDAGLELIGAGKNCDYRTYKIIECGHLSELKVGAVRKDEISCNQCFRERLIKEARDAGLELIGLGKGSHYRTYRIIQCGHVREIQTGKVRTGAIQCKLCINDRLIKEAEDAGLELISTGKSRAYRTYKVIECGHVSEFHIGSVKSGGVQCQQCMDEKHAKEAEDAGLELIGKGTNRKNRTYKFIQCGHVRELPACHVRNKVFECKQCTNERHVSEAQYAGLELIGAGKDACYRTYKIIECGHLSEFRVDAVRKDEIGCQQCFRERLIKEARDVGLELISAGKSRAYRTYKFIQCGHIREIELAAVRKNYFQCHECEESHWDQEKSLYLFEIEEAGKSWLKLGIAKNVETRGKGYGLSKSAETNLLYELVFEDGYAAYSFEQQLRGEFKAYKLCSEEMKIYHKKSGFDECYDIKTKTNLFKAIDKMAA